MKGKVLGFDPAAGSGAINGDDGKRYKFTAADNKGAAPLKANDTVDFEVDGDNAKEIYPVKTGFSMPAGAAPAGAAGAAAGGDFMKVVLAQPTIIWAAIIILGALVGNYIGAAQAASALGQFGGMMNSMAAAFGGGGMGGGNNIALGANLLYLMLAIPVVAGVQIFFELTNHKMTAQFRFITAIVAIAGPIVIPILSVMLMGFGFRFPAIDVGFLLVVGGGVLVLLTHLGIIKKLG